LPRRGRLTQVLINDAEGVPSAETVADRFGSLNEAYAAIGYDPPGRFPFGMNGKHWSKQAILRGLQKLHAAQGYISNRLIDSFPDLPSKGHIQRRFGSIQDANKQAGLPVLSHSEAQAAFMDASESGRVR
jgi:hypothetical protein